METAGCSATSGRVGQLIPDRVVAGGIPLLRSIQDPANGSSEMPSDNRMWLAECCASAATASTKLAASVIISPRQCYLLAASSRRDVHSLCRPCSRVGAASRRRRVIKAAVAKKCHHGARPASLIFVELRKRLMRPTRLPFPAADTRRRRKSGSANYIYIPQRFQSGSQLKQTTNKQDGPN